MTVTVPLPQGGYPVHIQPGALRQTGALLAPLGIDRWAVTADETVAALYGGAVLDSLRSAGLSGQLLTFPAGEAHKTPETWLSLCRQLAQKGFTRSDGLLALGGGVTGDMAGFVAACYQRGMALAQLPTTLLSQVDSAVGGKTAVDLPEGKNLLGAFWQPALVLSDTACLATLPPRQLSSGMAEVIKCACIADAPLLDALEAPSPPAPEKLAAACCRIKARCVAADERDSGLRRLLNFGHTFGHAYEALGGYQSYTHGEAVAAGMAQMLRWQMAHGLGGGLLLTRLEHLLAHYGLPTAIDCGGDALRRYLSQDKKTAEAMKAQEELVWPYLPLFTEADSNGDVLWLQIIKEGLKLRGVDAGYCRKPVISELPEEDIIRLKNVLKHYGYLA